MQPQQPRGKGAAGAGAAVASLCLALPSAVVRLDPATIALDDLLNLLRGESAPVGTWLAAAHGLLAAGRDKDYERLLGEAVDRGQPAPGGPDVFPHIQALCSLAEFAVQAAAGADRRERAELLSRVTHLCNRARQLSLGGEDHLLPELVLGQAALVRGDMDTARKGFEKALRLKCNGRPSVAAQLALANLHFTQKNYGAALKLYKAALKSCPACPPEVRLGVAACCLKLGGTAKAELAYRRVLELSPDCIPALLGLAVLRLHTSSEDEGVREGSRLLAEAFERDSENPHVLLLLAHFCLRQGFSDKARALAGAVAGGGAATGGAALQAEALTILARAHHALGSWQDAYKAYSQAHQLDPKLPLPKLGLAQASVWNNQPQNAYSLLETVLADTPHWIDALQVLGRVHPRAGQAGSAAALERVAPQLKAVAEQRPTDSELWELLGDLLSALDPAGALKAYDRAIDIRRKAAADEAAADAAAADGAAANGHAAAGAARLPARLLNNAAVLHLRAGEKELASQLMAQAFEAARTAAPGELNPLTQVTLGYNLARVKEACGELQAAERDYQALLAQAPEYGDCCLRLACVAKARGNIKGALEWTERAASMAGFEGDALALQAGLHMERRDWANAKQALDALLALREGGGGGGGSSAKLEQFGRIARANLHAVTAPSGRKSADEVLRAESHLSHALEQYRRVLEKDEGCISAANGIGCVLAEMGDINSAKEVFLQVQEASAATAGFWSMPDAWVNLANVYLEREQYASAIQMYQSALRKFYDNRSANVMLFLARAQYDADQLPEAKRTLTKALHLEPTDNQLRFDVALTLQQWAVRTLQRERPAGDPGKLQDFLKAQTELSQAHRFFQALHALGKAGGVDVARCTQHVNFCAKSHEEAKRLIVHAQKEAEDARVRREQAAAEVRAEQIERQLAAQQRAAEEEARKRQLEEMRREQQEQLAAKQVVWRNTVAVAKATEKGDGAAAAKSAAEAAAAAKEAALNELFMSEEEDEDYDPDADLAEQAQQAQQAAAAAAAGGGGAAQPPAALDDDLFGSDAEADDSPRAGGASGAPAAVVPAAAAAAPAPAPADVVMGDAEGLEDEGSDEAAAEARPANKRRRAVLEDDEDEDE